jgi:hypothetical protein
MTGRRLVTTEKGRENKVVPFAGEARATTFRAASPTSKRVSEM